MKSTHGAVPTPSSARVLVAVAGSLLFSGCIFTENEPAAFHLGAQYHSKFMHRGMVQNDRGGLQANIGADMQLKTEGLLRVKSLANMDLSADAGNAWFPDRKAGRFTEIDLVASYFHGFDMVDLEVGAFAYVHPFASEFPNGARGSTTEVFGTVGFPLFSDEWFRIRPFGSVHADFDESNGLYAQAGIQKEIAFADFETFAENEFFRNLAIDLQVMAGYSDEGHSWWAYGLEDVGLSDVQGRLRVSYHFSPQFRVFAGVDGSVVIDDELRDWFDVINIGTDNVWGTVGVGWTF